MGRLRGVHCVRGGVSTVNVYMMSCHWLRLWFGLGGTGWIFRGLFGKEGFKGGGLHVCV